MERSARKLKNILTGSLIFLLLLAGFFLLQGYFKGHFRSEDTFRAYLDSFGLFAPLILALIQALQVVLPVLPGFLGCIVGAGMFGAAGGFWCNYIGISAGSIAAFFLARYFGVELVKLMVPMEKYQKWVQWVNTKKSYTLVLFLAILLPLACETYPVYTLNRRVWTLFTTEHFGPVIQTAIGALIVGGIVNDRENCRVRRGAEMGHFELAGSTIVLLFQRDRLTLAPHIKGQAAGGRELRVEQGMFLGKTQRRPL